MCESIQIDEFNFRCSEGIHLDPSIEGTLKNDEVPFHLARYWNHFYCSEKVRIHDQIYLVRCWDDKYIFMLINNEKRVRHNIHIDLTELELEAFLKCYLLNKDIPFNFREYRGYKNSTWGEDDIKKLSKIVFSSYHSR